MHPTVERILNKRGMARAAFESACAEACRMLGDQQDISARMQVSAALASAPGGRLCDVGGSISAYLVVCHVLGTEVTVVDTLPYAEPREKERIQEIAEEVRRRLELFDRIGIRIDRSDAYEMSLPADHFDAAVAFETMEHFPHSPKPVLDKMAKSLKPGGRLCLSVPNLARIEMRFRVLAGRTAHENFAEFFREGYPHLGHHREYTLSEFEAIPAMLGLETVQVFSVNATYESRKRKNASQRFMIDLEERYGLGDRVLPPTWRKHVWLEARKASS
ncbi:class I SAM-dependent methyltransferase [Methylobacterium sp. C25]|uniref:class I SAM-dependent methyltransferase n=1 Tax=Methylobacterium sp. C25 TaxID=2721622 RepID=UPI001F317C05|nr:class I SAM-dependent methyltransferase [Methylobacterium sp. C25]MCE4226101.1 class I SAM-dependent methyltransferase [Methylobacterium sp. C25]